MGLCGYELAALGTGRLPPVSAVCREHRTAEAALLAVLLVHLHHKLPSRSQDQHRHPRQDRHRAG